MTALKLTSPVLIAATVASAAAFSMAKSPMASIGAPAQGESIARRWEGTVTYTQTLNWPTEVGDIVSHIEMDVRWGERQRIDVTDDRGAVVGQLIILEEDGSSWTGRLAGITTRQTVCDVTVTNYAGTGNGDTTIRTGWVYFSLVEDDPLAGRIPSGTYHVIGDARQQFQGTMTGRTDRFCNPAGSRTFSSEVPGGVVGFRMGKEPMSWNNPVPVNQIPASSMLQAYENADAINFDTLPTNHTDQKKRQLIGGAMVGTWNAGGESVRWVAEWDVRRKLDVAILLEEPDRDWWPSGEPRPNTVSLKARFDNDTLEGRFRFRLAEVTEEPGYALNAGNFTNKDLEFASGQAGFEAAEETDDGWTIEGTEAANEIEIIVQALDYGAWGRLSCEAMVDGDWYACETAAGAFSVTLPLDDDLDLIADSWAEDNATGGSNDTDPKPSGTEEDNDGLSNYEEYRGVLAQGIHYRTDPKTKTLFLRDDQGLARSTTALTIFDLYYLSSNEVGGADGRVANFNQCEGAHAGHHLDDQYAVVVTNGGLSNTWNWGCAFPCVGRALGPPSSCTDARIYVPQITADMATWNNGTFAGLGEIIISQVVDHEIGHCIGTHHHHIDAPSVAGTAADGPVCTMRYYFNRIFNNTITAADIGAQFCESISLPRIDLSDPS